MKRAKTKRAWFFDISGNLEVVYREYEPGMCNTGDYHTHDWCGPYKTFRGAKREAMKRLRAELNLAQWRYDKFNRQQEP